jgi:ABC-type transport system involved in cytochrome c biogenesis permease subunit
MRTQFDRMAAVLVATLVLPWMASAQEALPDEHAGHNHAAHDHAAHAATESAPDTPPPVWSDNIIDLFSSLPVQDEGRVKPLDTFAQFTLLKFNGKRSYSLSEEEQATHGGKKRLTSIEWLLNVLFYPETAKNYRNFIVDNAEAVTAIGVETHGKMRDRYSYNELIVGRNKLSELAMQYFDIDAKQRTPVQEQVLNLAHNINQFEYLLHYLNFATAHYHLESGSGLEVAFPEGDNLRASVILTRLPGLVEELRKQVGTTPQSELPPAVDTTVRALTDLLGTVQGAAAPSQALALFPPSNPETKEWLSATALVDEAVDFDTPSPQGQLEAMGHLEDMVLQRDQPLAFESALASLNKALVSLASARGEYDKIPVELAFYRGKYLFYSQWLYVFGFVLVAMGLLLPRNRFLAYAGPIGVLVPTILLIIGITLRCIVRERPPVTTLYETILFITAVVAVVGLLIELMNRQRIALTMASMLGVIGLFIAYRYEAKEGIDTMPNLVAVLDTNFWLSTHVTTVTMGYAAGLLAAALAHIYIFGKRFNLKKDDHTFYKNITRMTYGVLCFGFLFSCVGTILGGIWANYSWGRFWGWDPKENGALMICLWGLVILHARMGGFIRDLGVAITSVVMGMIVAFSWWGVNLLGVGLHSYGFTNGIMNMLVIFWATESLVVMMGMTVGLKERALMYAGKKTKHETPDTAPQPTATARSGSVAHRSRNK